jgi:sortase A
MSKRSELALRAAAIALCAAGVLLIGDATLHYATGAYRADVARRFWERQQASTVVAQARARAANGVSIATGQIALGAPVARLRIPRIRLDEIVLEGVTDDELNAGPGHLPGSVLPGMNGNAIISAHRDRHFSHLDELQIGDTIQTETASGSGAWIIIDRRIVGRDTPALFESREPMLTLTTCWPVRYFGSAPDRLILSAKRVIGTWATRARRRAGDT